MDKNDYEKFLELAKKLTEEQYDCDENNDYSDYKDILRDKYNEQQDGKFYEQDILPLSQDSIINLTDSTATPEEVEKQISNASNIRVGKFIIKIRRYYGTSERLANFGKDLDLSILEEKNKIAKKVNVIKDGRFRDADWKEYFSKSINCGKDIPLGKVVEIIRWLQVINKMSIFF